MDENKKKLTGEKGAPAADHYDAATAGPRGPIVLRDAWFFRGNSAFRLGGVP